MSMESDLFNAIKALVGNRCFPDVAPEGTATPYITWQQVGGPAYAYVEKAVPNLEGARMQITVWSATRLEANTIIRQVEPALVAASGFEARPIGGFTATFDRDTGLRGSRQDFYIWSPR